MSSVVFIPCGNRIASGSWDNTVRIWDAATGREVMALKEGDDRARSVAFSPDGMRIAAASGNAVLIYEADPWWEPGNPPKRPKPVTISPKPVPEAKPEGAGDEERF